MQPLSVWTRDELLQFLEIRQEFFLDPMGSNKARFLDAANLLQRALFDWYLEPPGSFDRMLTVVSAMGEQWSALRKEERRTLLQRRYALQTPTPDLPAVESSVSEHQWQRIFGSLGLGLREPGTFDRFLVQLDEETNPSLRVNHRYMGELLPHDNMISYFSSLTATFLNENAIIGKVSPCVTHMEDAAINWLLTLVGWDGGIRTGDETTVPLQRLPTAAAPVQRYQRWEREEPTGTIVAGGTIANVSAMLIARSAVFDYLLGWSGAVQWLGPALAWKLVGQIWGYDRLLVLTSRGAHYSVKKAALQAGVAPGNVVEIAGTKNPWILDGPALQAQLATTKKTDLVMAVVAIAGKTETGYVDRMKEVAAVLDSALEDPGSTSTLPPLTQVIERVQANADRIEEAIRTISSPGPALDAFEGARTTWGGNPPDLARLLERVGEGDRNEIREARHNRLFLHVDAAHGGGFLTVPSLRQQVFEGIELADTITIDGHKSFYCYYPCGGLLVRTTRWAQTFSIGHSAYISEDENRGVYREGLVFAQALANERHVTLDDKYDENIDPAEHPKINFDERFRARLNALYRLVGRPVAADRSELTHHPFNEYLEGSRGPQGIMQLYFNLSTLGLQGYRAILGWTTLLRARAEEAISLGMTDIRSVTDQPLRNDLYATDKLLAVHANGLGAGEFPDSPEQSQVVPVGGGRFLRLSDGECNQLLISYVPAREAKLIATASAAYWEKRGVRLMLRLMRYLWRVNEHLWNEHIYANPHFTYYLGHTALDLDLPSAGTRQESAKSLALLLASWNAWARRKDGSCPFFDALLKAVADAMDREDERKTAPAGRTQGEKKGDAADLAELRRYARKFFCHKVITMHPYSDESLLGDMLRRLAFWGERSVTDVAIADATANLLFPDSIQPEPEIVGDD
jgi:glutamate/tyrosine decarboxylase-like PLP-dependent enzyme